MKNRNVPRSAWLGTFLLLYDDGRAERVTIYPSGDEDVIPIKPKD